MGRVPLACVEPTISLSFFHVQRLAACFGEGAFGDLFLAMVATLATDRMLVVQVKLRRPAVLVRETTPLELARESITFDTIHLDCNK
jgi:hypothetical protein